MRSNEILFLEGGSTGFFWGVYYPTLSVYYVGINRDIGKRLPQPYYIRVNICYEPYCTDIGVAMAT